MFLRFAFSSLLILTLQTLALNLNSSLLPSTLQSHPFSPFKDILRVIAAKQHWNNLQELRISDVTNARAGSSQRFEFRIRIGGTGLVIRFGDEVSPWKRLRRKDGNWVVQDLINGAGSKPVIQSFKLQGPLELRTDCDDGFSLLLPLNTTLTGLNRVLVGEGITVEVQGASQVSLFHPSNFGLTSDWSFLTNTDISQYWSLGYPSCMPLLHVHIIEPVSLVAYRTRNTNAYVETTFPYQGAVELLPEKCYTNHLNKNPIFPNNSLNSKLAILKKLLRSFLGERIFHKRVFRILKAKITATTLVRFQLELERDVGSNETIWNTLETWRTRPSVQRFWFEIVARMNGDQLKPLVVKKLRPFIVSDSVSWSNLMANVSFTHFPSLIVPSESLTLDVKW